MLKLYLNYFSSVKKKIHLYFDYCQQNLFINRFFVKPLFVLLKVIKYVSYCLIIFSFLFFVSCYFYYVELFDDLSFTLPEYFSQFGVETKVFNKFYIMPSDDVGLNRIFWEKILNNYYSYKNQYKASFYYSNNFVFFFDKNELPTDLEVAWRNVFLIKDDISYFFDRSILEHTFKTPFFSTLKHTLFCWIFIEFYSNIVTKFGNNFEVFLFEYYLYYSLIFKYFFKFFIILCNLNTFAFDLLKLKSQGILDQSDGFYHIPIFTDDLKLERDYLLDYVFDPRLKELKHEVELTPEDLYIERHLDSPPPDELETIRAYLDMFRRCKVNIAKHMPEYFATLTNKDPIQRFWMVHYKGLSAFPRCYSIRTDLLAIIDVYKGAIYYNSELKKDYVHYLFYNNYTVRGIADYYYLEFAFYYRNYYLIVDTFTQDLLKAFVNYNNYIVDETSIYWHLRFEHYTKNGYPRMWKETFMSLDREGRFLLKLKQKFLENYLSPQKVEPLTFFDELLLNYSLLVAIVVLIISSLLILILFFIFVIFNPSFRIWFFLYTFKVTDLKSELNFELYKSLWFRYLFKRFKFYIFQLQELIVFLFFFIYWPPFLLKSIFKLCNWFYFSLINFFEEKKQALTFSQQKKIIERNLLLKKKEELKSSYRDEIIKCYHDTINNYDFDKNTIESFYWSLLINFEKISRKYRKQTHLVQLQLNNLL